MRMSQARLRSGAEQPSKANSPLSGLTLRDPLNTEAPRRPVSIFFGGDRGMAFFLAFLVITTVVVLMVPLPLLGRLALSFTFALTRIFGAYLLYEYWYARVHVKPIKR